MSFNTPESGARRLGCAPAGDSRRMHHRCWNSRRRETSPMPVPLALALLMSCSTMGGCNYQIGQHMLESGDPPRAAGIFQDLSDLGDPEATLALANLYAQGKGVPANPAHAEQLARWVVDHGQPWQLNWTQYLLGTLAERDGRPTDAAAWYAPAVEVENPWAMMQLAGLYRDGRGVPVNAPRAADLFRGAADRGVPDAATALGDLYLEGRGVP